MVQFSFQESFGNEQKAYIVFLFLYGIEAVCVLPFAYILPSPSKAPLILAAGLVAAVNSAMFATVRNKVLLMTLLAVNLVGIILCLRIALDPSRYLSSASHLEIAIICLGVFVVGLFALPDGPMRSFLPAQQWALACTLISWMLVQQLRTHLGTLPAMDVHALFIGPPTVAFAALLSGFTGRKKWYIVAWVGIGLAQFWIGIFDLAGHLDAPAVGRATIGLMALFLLVLAAAATPGRWSRLSPTFRQQS